jgi:hypothetical protein
MARCEAIVSGPDRLETSPRGSRGRGQWSPGRTFLVIVGTVVVAAFAWWAYGYLAAILVLVAGLLASSYFGTERFSNWRTGRPSRVRREMAESLVTPPRRAGEPLAARPDVVEDWLHERLFDDGPDGSA